MDEIGIYLGQLIAALLRMSTGAFRRFVSGAGRRP